MFTVKIKFVPEIKDFRSLGIVYVKVFKNFECVDKTQHIFASI